jgi:hypothetical protein
MLHQKLVANAEVGVAAGDTRSSVADELAVWSLASLVRGTIHKPVLVATDYGAAVVDDGAVDLREGHHASSFAHGDNRE